MRNSSTPALVLNVQPQGENNRTATVFAPGDGIFYATLYGGPKSKLRSLVSPMNAGIMYLYKDETRKATKITDFDVKRYHLSFRENLFKMWAASLAAEIVIKTKCAGSPSPAWTLVNGFLDGMELTDEQESKIGLIRFLWRYLALLGICPPTASCCQCGNSFIAGKFTNDSVLYKYIFDERENGFICPDCADAQYRQDGRTPFMLARPAITYLEAIRTLSPKEVRNIIIDEPAFLELKQLCFHLIELACGTKLKSLESGIGIL